MRNKQISFHQLKKLKDIQERNKKANKNSMLFSQKNKQNEGSSFSKIQTNIEQFNHQNDKLNDIILREEISKKSVEKFNGKNLQDDIEPFELEIEQDENYEEYTNEAINRENKVLTDIVLRETNKRNSYNKFNGKYKQKFGNEIIEDNDIPMAIRQANRKLNDIKIREEKNQVAYNKFSGKYKQNN